MKKTFDERVRDLITEEVDSADGQTMDEIISDLELIVYGLKEEELAD